MHGELDESVSEQLRQRPTLGNEIIAALAPVLQSLNPALISGCLSLSRSFADTFTELVVDNAESRNSSLFRC